MLFTIRTAIEHQQWTKDYFIEEDMDPLTFVGSMDLSVSPAYVAMDILKHIDISPDEQCKCHTRDEALRFWMRKAENAGIFIFRERSVDPRECRGFVISDEYAPFVFLNTEDAKAGLLFTLLHEIAHIWVDQSGISNLSTVGSYQFIEASVIETFCNKVASEALLVRDRFEHEWIRLDASLKIEEKIEKLSRIFKVSDEAIARRLLDDGRISSKNYEELRDFYQTRWREQKAAEKKRRKETGRGPSFYVTKVSQNGYAYTHTVVSAFNGGQISGREASSLLNVKVNHIPKLATTAGFPFPVRL